MGERMIEVEVVCPNCSGVGGDTECCGRSGPECCGEPAVVRCSECLGEGRLTEFAPPGSLTAARLRLADAAEAMFGEVFDYPDARGLPPKTAEWNAALAALRTKRAGG